MVFVFSLLLFQVPPHLIVTLVPRFFRIDKFSVIGLLPTLIFSIESCPEEGHAIF